MPIRIKKPEFKPYDKKYRIFTVTAMITAIVFAGALIGLMGTIVKSESKVASLALFAAYILYFAASVLAFAGGVRCYGKEDNLGVLAQSVFHLAVIIFCFMNLRFALILIFSALGADSAAEALRGAQTYTEFISTQYVNWVCLMAGVLCTIVVGIFGIVRLAKK